MEGLEECNKLINEATKHSSTSTSTTEEEGEDDGGGSESRSRIVLRDELYRVALSDEQAKQLQKTANEEVLPNNMAQFLTKEEIQNIVPSSSSSSSTSTGAAITGGLRLSNGCKVIHLPSYLKGLWSACISHDGGGGTSAAEIMSTSSTDDVNWTIIEDSDEEGDDEKELLLWKERLRNFDVVVLSAGSGLFGGPSSTSFCTTDSFPIQLVGGQSVELSLSDTTNPVLEHAVLCGKYISPLPEEGSVLVGATHEFSSKFMSEDEVTADLKERTNDVVPDIWTRGTVKKISRGVRVQAERGKYGRRPLIGRFPTSIHSNAWIFTGLSSRGLLYHGLYGKMLANAILCDSEEVLVSRCKDILWWRR